MSRTEKLGDRFYIRRKSDKMWVDFDPDRVSLVVRDDFQDVEWFDTCLDDACETVREIVEDIGQTADDLEILTVSNLAYEFTDGQVALIETL